jgi:hypothetical protein
MNWPVIIAETMMKSKRLVEAELPYAVLISKFLKYFEISTDGEVKDDTTVRRNCHIKQKHIEKLGMKKIGNNWTIGATPVMEEEHEEDNLVLAVVEQPIPQWSPFETLVLQKFDSILQIQNEHTAALQNIQLRLNDLEARMAEDDMESEAF